MICINNLKNVKYKLVKMNIKINLIVYYIQMLKPLNN